MEKGSPSERRFWRKVQAERFTVSTLVSSEPCFVFQVNLRCEKGGEDRLYLYDGQSAADRLKWSVGTVAGGDTPCAFDPPLYFAKGLYILLGDHVTDLCVEYMQDPGPEGDLQ